MIQILFTLLAAIQVATTDTPVVAEDKRPVIWNGLRLGMSKAEVKAKHPKNLVPVGNGCHIVAYPRFNKTGLVSIDMEWSVKDPAVLRCGELVRQTLASKYGEPDQAEREIKDNDCGNQYAEGLAGALAGLCKSMGGEEPDYFQLYRWNRDGVEISFKIDAKADDPKWWAVYRMTPVAGDAMKSIF